MKIPRTKPSVDAKAPPSNQAVAVKKPQAAAPVAAPPPPQAAVAKKSAKAPKEKRVRSSFSMPESQFALIAELKMRCGGFGVAPRKSELLAAGLHALKNLSETSLEAEILPSLRPARKAVKAKQRKK
jgi:hypothetical protein